MRRALALAALSLLLPAAAQAATVSAEAVPGRGVVYYVVTYSAAPGEANDLTEQPAPDGITLVDTGAEMTAGEGCTTITAHSATCTRADTSASLHASLGDEKDHFTSEGPGFDVQGGPGDDVLDGGAAGGYLRGGDGEDLLQGGKTVTWFYGGPGNDTMTGTDETDRFTGGSGADSIDGRGEIDFEFAEGDVVSYADHGAPVTVDLSDPSAPVGAKGEGDTIANVESAIGGDGDDRLTARKDTSSTGYESALDGSGGDDLIRGGPGRDRLYGDDGDDSVRGGGGDDRVSGGPGHDTLIGGGGTNELWSFDLPRPERDLVRCGEAGSAYAGSAAEPVLDLVDQSCGHVDLWGPIVSRVAYGYPGHPTRAVRSTVTCLRHCGVTVALRAHGKLLGSAMREIRGTGSATMTIPLTRAARDELERTGRLRLGFFLDASWGARLRHPQATSWHLLLHETPAAR
jgi:Ca2+-binding RTX toxin-like protein